MTDDKIEDWLWNLESLELVEIADLRPECKKLISLVRLYRNELFSYSSGDEFAEEERHKLEEKALKITRAV